MAPNTQGNEPEKYPFWSLSLEETAEILRTDIHNGITEEEAAERLETFGANVIEKTRQAGDLFIVLNQFRSPLILILLFAGCVTLLLSHYQDALFIFVALIVNIALGFYQEHKAEKALAELKTYLKQRARVIRNNLEYETDADNLVPGDIIRLGQGDRVPADGRLIFENDLFVDEAILTGETLPNSKQTNPVGKDAVLDEQSSMIFAGTLVTQGIATAVVCRTNLSTEFGKIAALVTESEREETPLQTAIKRFSLQAGLFLGVLTFIVFVVGVELGHSRIEMFLTSVAIAVAAVPEGLPIAMTVILAIGVEKIAKRKGVIRKLVATEALGSTTVILTDKTGTLTTAKMELSKIESLSNKDERRLLELALLNTNVVIENKDDKPSLWRINGRILETALVRSAAIRNVTIEETKKRLSIKNFLPFNAVNKFSISLLNDHGKRLLVFFGAPDTLINHSSLNQIQRNEVLEKIDSLARSGELVVGIATKEIEASDNPTSLKNLKVENLTFDGLITLRDPIRTDVQETVRQIKTAGIKVIILTGDHRGTAEAIARETGILANNNMTTIDATEMQNMSDDDLKKRLSTIRVISRVSPTNKLRIVKLFQELGEVVAMIGDGVNDAPSIKQANIGIAMGSGTELARDVADLVLLDDNLKTVVAAIEEGRHITNNIRKVLVYLLSSVADELLLIGGAMALGLALPLNALQILWVNFFSDSFPAVAFAFEKEDNVLTSQSQKIKTELFDPLMKFLIIFIGLSTSALLFVLYWLMLKINLPEDLVKTFVFASFGTYTLFLTFSVKSLEKSILEYNVFSNRYLVAGVSVGIIMMAIAIYLPPLQSLFGTVPLPPIWLLGVLLVGILNIAAVECGKLIFRRKSLLSIP